MADQFIAQIEAELKTQSLENSIKNFKSSEKIKLDVDTKYLQNQIQSAINGVKITWNPKISSSGSGGGIGSVLKADVEKAIEEVSSQKINLGFNVSKDSSDNFKKEIDSMISELQKAGNTSVSYKINTQTVFDENTKENIEKLVSGIFSYTTATGEAITKTIAFDSELDRWIEKSATYSSSAKQLKESVSSIFDTTDASNQGIKYIEDITGTIDKEYSKIKQMQLDNGWSDIKITGVEEANGDIQKLTVTYTEATGAVKQFNMARSEIDSGGSTSSGLVQSSDVKVIKTVQQAYEELEKTIASSMASFSKTSTNQESALLPYSNLNSTSLTSARKYVDEYKSILSDLQTAYNENTGSLDINVLKNLGWDDSQIQSVKQKLGELETAFSSAMAKIKQDAQGVNIGQIFSQLNTEEFQTKVASLEQQISKIGDRTTTSNLSSCVVQLNQLIADMNDAKQNGDMSKITESYSRFTTILRTASNEASTFQKNMSTSGKITGYENQLNSLKEVYSTTKEYQDAWRALTEYSSYGIGSIDDVGKAFSVLTAKVKETETAVSSASDKIKNGFYSSTSSSLTSQVSVFGNFSSDNINQLRDYASEYERIQKELTSSYNIDTGKWLISDQEVAKKKQQLDEIQASFNNLMKEIKADFGTNNIAKQLDISSFQTQVNKITQQIESLGNTGVTSSLSSLSTEIKSVMSEAETAWNTGNVDAYNSKIEELKKLLSDAKVQLAGLGSTNISSGANGISSFISSLSSGWQSLTKIIGTGFITREIRSAAKEMVSTVKEIDSSMAQLQIVTGATDSEMNEFLESSISLAKELGQSVSDVLGVVETYSRLGYDLEDSSVLAEYSAILSNVAGVDIEDATSGLTSVIKGFSLDVSEVEEVSSALIEVGQNYAVSASEILEAFEKSSAALAATGATYQEAAAIIAAGNAAVQDASQHTGSKNMDNIFLRTRLIARTA